MIAKTKLYLYNIKNKECIKFYSPLAPSIFLSKLKKALDTIDILNVYLDNDCSVNLFFSLNSHVLKHFETHLVDIKLQTTHTISSNYDFIIGASKLKNVSYLGYSLYLWEGEEGTEP